MVTTRLPNLLRKCLTWPFHSGSLTETKLLCGWRCIRFPVPSDCRKVKSGGQEAPARVRWVARPRGVRKGQATLPIESGHAGR